MVEKINILSFFLSFFLYEEHSPYIYLSSYPFIHISLIFSTIQLRSNSAYGIYSIVFEYLKRPILFLIVVSLGPTPPPPPGRGWGGGGIRGV